MPTEEPSDAKSDLIDYFKKACPFRFLKRKHFIFQVTSYKQFRDNNLAINICCEVISIHGFYKLHFYTNYWFINNTELPLTLKFQERDYEYPEIHLPFKSKEEIEGEHRTQAWTKFKLIKGSTKGIMDVGMDKGEQPFYYDVDLERQFGFVLEENDSEGDNEELKDNKQGAKVDLKDPKKKFTYHQKHEFPAMN